MYSDPRRSRGRARASTSEAPQPEHKNWTYSRPDHVTPNIHGICLAGGSAFGLEAASGVRNYLEQKGIGFTTRAAKVPIVPGAILYDLAIGKANVRPTREMGEAAAKAATTAPVAEGNVGAGTGATVGKIRGMAQAMKGGVGTFTVQLGPKVKVSALVAVNPVGDVIEPNTGRNRRRRPQDPGFARVPECCRGDPAGSRSSPE